MARQARGCASLAARHVHRRRPAGTVHEEVNSLKRGSGKSRHKMEHNLVARVSEEGVTFRSYRDGTAMLLSPESSVQAQKRLGADIIIPLDELPPYHTEPAALAASLARSHRWMARSLQTHLADVAQQAMYAVVHGGMSLELRHQSIDYLTSLPFDGFAVGGSLGRNRRAPRRTAPAMHAPPAAAEAADARALLRARWRRDDLFWLMQRIMPRLHERGAATKPVHVLGIADPGSIPQVGWLCQCGWGGAPHAHACAACSPPCKCDSPLASHP